MPNIAAVLKEEIARVARKELRKSVDPLRKQVAVLRRDNAALKRDNAALRRELSSIARRRPAAQASVAKDESAGGRHRFSADGLKKMRAKLGLSAASFGKLIGASALSVYHWENGKVRPRADAIARIAALRGKGKREVQKMLGE